MGKPRLMRSFLLFFASLQLCSIAHAQVPNSFNYQSVVRDGFGVLINSQQLGIKVSIVSDSLGGAVEYSETHSASTNANGLFSIQIGNGTAVSGSFNSIDWTTADLHYQIEIDLQGGSNYTLTSFHSFTSVPYAMVAERAIMSDDADADSTNEIQLLSLLGDTLSLSRGGSVVLPQKLPFNPSYGDLVIRDSTSWKTLPAGANNQLLTICDGLPTWTNGGVCPTIPTITTFSISSIGPNTAQSGGSITSDGGLQILNRGICWSTSQNPTIYDDTISVNNAFNTFGATMTNLQSSTTYYVRAFASNSKGVGYGNEYSFTTLSNFVLGGTGPGGGTIFYLAPNTTTDLDGDGDYDIGLEAGAKQPNAQWGCYPSGSWPVAYGSVIGTGRQNTIAIVNTCGGSSFAAALCSNYSGGGFNDWYLPSIDELTTLLNVLLPNVPCSGNYWSSTTRNQNVYGSNAFSASIYSNCSIAVMDYIAAQYKESYPIRAF